MLGLICAAPLIINLTSSWTDFDDKVMSRAKYVCKVEYQKCLKTFIKKEPRLFNAICGIPKEEGNDSITRN